MRWGAASQLLPGKSEARSSISPLFLSSLNQQEFIGSLPIPIVLHMPPSCEVRNAHRRGVASSDWHLPACSIRVPALRSLRSALSALHSTSIDLLRPEV